LSKSRPRYLNSVADGIIFICHEDRRDYALSEDKGYMWWLFYILNEFSDLVLSPYHLHSNIICGCVFNNYVQI